MYQFRMPIGDWSQDGHSQCDYYLIQSNKSVEEVREIHFSVPDKTGVNIEEICSDYEESSVDSETMEKIIELGFYRNLKQDSYEEGKETNFSSEDMCKLWIFLLMKADPTLQLEISKDYKMEMLPFFGFDEKGRHIGFVGYGTFSL
ncbi:hypothetical protein SMD22_01215 (plasmid) [Brevibacillus halotolerans]|nr:hypothetical protein SMD22_01215 [Brevibacillus halotolerans]